jgi:hypothetical protein
MADWALERYSFQDGQIVDFRSMRMSNLEEQKNKPFLEGENGTSLTRKEAVENPERRGKWKCSLGAPKIGVNVVRGLERGSELVPQSDKREPLRTGSHGWKENSCSEPG